MWLSFHYHKTNFINNIKCIKYITSVRETKGHNVCVPDTRAGHNTQLKASGNSMKISIWTGWLCKGNNKLVLMINRLSYLYTRARGQHTLWHPSSLSNAVHNDTGAWWEKSTHTHANLPSWTHTHVNAHKHTVLIFSATFSLSHKHRETSSHTHTHKNLPVFNTTG